MLQNSLSIPTFRSSIFDKINFPIPINTAYANSGNWHKLVMIAIFDKQCNNSLSYSHCSNGRIGSILMFQQVCIIIYNILTCALTQRVSGYFISYIPTIIRSLIFFLEQFFQLFYISKRSFLHYFFKVVFFQYFYKITY